MRENKITVIIDKPIDKVFEFTTNPQNTHLWIPSISVEIADEYPPKINTRYKNRGERDNWDEYKVVDIKTNEVFILSDLDENYFVKYTYRKLGDNKTEMEYYEWMTNGELSKPFTESILGNLKKII
ncbi:SRPBCC family protein [Patescibacteria group bacterium]|nr:SRPBCC family protein [Patescibacteria group bacterium]